METIIIMTEVKDSLYGRYVKFTIKGDRKVIAEVDRRKQRQQQGWDGA